MGVAENHYDFLLGIDFRPSFFKLAVLLPEVGGLQLGLSVTRLGARRSL
jgi:hypothetical protein